jgi:hypothetical protein
MTKIAGSGSVSPRHKSVSQRHGSADPGTDPNQNVTDPQPCYFPKQNKNLKRKGSQTFLLGYHAFLSWQNVSTQGNK